MLRKAKRAVAFTGAGVSTESGIPDYRSPGGLWTRRTPPTIQEFLADEAGRRDYWEFYREFFPVISRARPNAGHLALARLHRAGRLAAVVTQNVDGLHQAAGLPEPAVLELHGAAARSACLDCGGYREDTGLLLEEFARRGRAPVCPLCGGPVKPCTISFGQALEPRVLERAAELCARADLLLAAGSSLSVTPAAELPLLAARAGGALVIINRDPTPLDGLARAVIRESAGMALERATDLALGQES